MAAWRARSIGTPLTDAADLSVTNGKSAVSLSIVGERAIALGPSQARALGIALLNASANVIEGQWGGPEYQDAARAVAEIERMV